MPIRGRSGHVSRLRPRMRSSLWDSAMPMPCGFIQPMRGVTSRMRSVRWLYALTAPIYPGLQKVFGRWVTSTDRLA
jgi:hypothetical protein